MYYHDLIQIWSGIFFAKTADIWSNFAYFYVVIRFKLAILDIKWAVYFIRRPYIQALRNLMYSNCTYQKWKYHIWALCNRHFWILVVKSATSLSKYTFCFQWSLNGESLENTSSYNSTKSSWAVLRILSFSLGKVASSPKLSTSILTEAPLILRWLNLKKCSTLAQIA